MKSFLKRILKKMFRGVVNDLVRENLAKQQEIFINSTTGKNVVISPPYRIADSSIGDYSYITINAKLSMTEVGKFCSIGPNLLCGWGIHPTNGISTAPMFYSTLRQNGMTLSATDKIAERKKILIGNDVFIGSNVIILDGVTIGDGAVIGAGAVVSKDIPPYAIAVGSPVQVIRNRFNDDLVNALLKLKWWDFTAAQLVDVEKHFFEVEALIKKYQGTSNQT